MIDFFDKNLKINKILGMLLLAAKAKANEEEVITLLAGGE